MLKLRLGLILAALALFLGVPARAQLFIYRPNQVYRTITVDAYELEIQKNGLINVRMPNGAALFEKVFPSVWFDGEDEPKQLPVRGNRTARVDVNDALGRGQGMLFSRKTCEWLIRAYVTEPFFTVQVAYVNTGNKPVKVRALSPWSIGVAEGGRLDIGQEPWNAIVLQRTQPSPGATEGKAELMRGRGSGPALLGIHNPLNHRAVVTGFLRNGPTNTHIALDRSGEADLSAFDVFTAACVYDPPVEVKPGQRIESKVLYVGVHHGSPLRALETFEQVLAKTAGK